MRRLLVSDRLAGPDRMPLPTRSVPLDEVEPASTIVKHFASGDCLPLLLLTMGGRTRLLASVCRSSTMNTLNPNLGLRV